MKKIAGWLGFILLVSLSTGCGRQETDDPAYHIYYLNKEKTKVVEQPYDLKEGKTEDMIATLLDALCTNTDSVEYQKPVPGDVTITDWSLESNQLFLYFNGNYSKMQSTDEVLCRAAVVKTLVQLPDVKYVSFYVGDAPLADSRDNVIGLMTEESFVENPGKQINSIQTTTLHLYYANADGNGLVECEKEVQYSSNISLEKLPEGTNLVNVTTTNGTCYVTLDEAFLNQNYEIQEPIVIYSIVDSLSEISTISKVQISVNGKTSGVYRDSFALDQLYERNLDYVVSADENETVSTEAQTEETP